MGLIFFCFAVVKEPVVFPVQGKHWDWTVHRPQTEYDHTLNDTCSLTNADNCTKLLKMCRVYNSVSKKQLLPSHLQKEASPPITEWHFRVFDAGEPCSGLSELCKYPCIMLVRTSFSSRMPRAFSDSGLKYHGLWVLILGVASWFHSNSGYAVETKEKITKKLHFNSRSRCPFAASRIAWPSTLRRNPPEGRNIQATNPTMPSHQDRDDAGKGIS